MAEQFLASWLVSRQKPVADIVAGSKWGSIYTVDWRVDVSTHEDKDHLLATLQRQWQESQVLVGSYLRLYQVHSATLESGVLNDAAVLAELARIKAGGLAVGLSSSGPNQAAVIERAVALEIDGGRLFDVVQATWNVLEPSAGPQLATARQAGVGVIVKEVVANGRLTGRNTVPSFQAQRQVLEHEARRLNTTLDALALAAARAQPWADTVLSGAATEQQL